MKKAILLFLALFIFSGITFGLYRIFSEKKEPVTIVFITDNNYVVPTVVAITSVQTNKKTDLDIYVVGQELTDENKAVFNQMNVHLIDHKNLFPEFKSSHRYVTETALTKFYLPQIFADKNKVLYLDADVIVQGDLWQLYQTDLKDNYAAAVKGLSETVFAKAHNRLHLKNYFNTGVMLLNLEKMRKDNITEKLINWKANQDQKYFMDQDVFNAVFEEKVIYLPPKYNFMASNYKLSTEKEIKQFYEITERPTVENAVIVHMVNIPKPWVDKTAFGHELWKKYYALSPLKDVERIYQ